MISMGGRGVVQVATPSLRANAGKYLRIRLFAGVCSLGIHFAPLVTMGPYVPPYAASPLAVHKTQ